MHARKLAATFILPSALGLGPALLSAGCSNSVPSSADTATTNGGEIALDLSLASGSVLNTVTYTITGPGGYVKTGSIDVSRSATVSTTLGGIPTGAGYSISLAGTTTDESTSCQGATSFSFVAHQTTPVAVAILCREQTRTGSVAVNGTLNICPIIDGINAIPSEVFVGTPVTLQGMAHDSDAGPAPLSYQWTATNGTLSSATAQFPSFTCAAAGAATVTLTVADGDASPTCGDTSSITITCSTPKCWPSCNDDNPCTDDVCNPDTTCSHTTVADGSLCQGGNLKVKILGFNDFHGQISAGKLVSNRPVGSAGVLSAYLNAAH